MAKSRTEIDKEMMYRKIMPSGTRTGRNGNSGRIGNNGGDGNENSNNGNDSGSRNSGKSENENGISGKVGNESRNTANNGNEIGNGREKGLGGDPDGLKLRIHSSSGLQLPESHDMVLVNLMEELVISRLESTLMRFNCCKCNKCKKDIAALALNRLAPKYVVINRDDEEKRKAAENEFGSEVTGALVQAIMVVKKEPRH